MAQRREKKRPVSELERLRVVRTGLYIKEFKKQKEESIINEDRFS